LTEILCTWLDEKNHTLLDAILFKVDVVPATAPLDDHQEVEVMPVEWLD